LPGAFQQRPLGAEEPDDRRIEGDAVHLAEPTADRVVPQLVGEALDVVGYVVRPLHVVGGVASEMVIRVMANRSTMAWTKRAAGIFSSVRRGPAL
jgi:hypothetical protein